MGELTTSLNQENRQKPVPLLNDRPSISARNYYENLDLLATCLPKSRKRVFRKLWPHSESSIMEALLLHRQKLTDLWRNCHRGNLKFLLKKCGEAPGRFAEVYKKQGFALLHPYATRQAADLRSSFPTIPTSPPSPPSPLSPPSPPSPLPHFPILGIQGLWVSGVIFTLSTMVGSSFSIYPSSQACISLSDSS